jgi:hypothetical protein
MLSLGACKKDALEVKQEKTFMQIKAQPATDLPGGGIVLTLKPDGTAGIDPGGDILWAATYKISGNKITVKLLDTNTKYKFTIVSDVEIHGENGEILKLVKQ